MCRAHRPRRLDRGRLRGLPPIAGQCRICSSVLLPPPAGRIAAGTDASNPMLVPGLQRAPRDGAPGPRRPYAPRGAPRRYPQCARYCSAPTRSACSPRAKSADLVVLSKDPLVDIRNTRAIHAVMARGYLLDADSIRATW